MHRIFVIAVVWCRILRGRHHRRMTHRRMIHSGMVHRTGCHLVQRWRFLRSHSGAWQNGIHQQGKDKDQRSYPAQLGPRS